MDRKWLISSMALGAAVLMPAPALAAPVTNSDGKATAEILVPLAVLEIEDLDFGTVITSGFPGTVFIPANGGAPVYTGGVTGMPSDPLFRGEFLVVGDPGRDIIVTYSWPLKLTSAAGDQIDLLAMYLNGNALRTLDAGTGHARLYFGGSILVGANQPGGLYEENFTVTVDYR